MGAQPLKNILISDEYRSTNTVTFFSFSITFHVEDFAVCLSEAKLPRGGDVINKFARIEFDESVLEVLTKLVGKSGKALLRINQYATTLRMNADPVVYEVRAFYFIIYFTRH